MQPPTQWIAAAMESRELLALCLRKLRGLSKVRIIDASFIWTEPHSKRIKVKITIQSEVGSIFYACGSLADLRRPSKIPFFSRLSRSSMSLYTTSAPTAQSPSPVRNSYLMPIQILIPLAHTWRACVQVRQKVPHKRTFLFLEQLMLKHNAHKDAINIKETKDGLDFFFAHRNHAEKLVDFLRAVSPVRSKKSEELISQDIHTSTKSYKFSFSVELVPICKDDLVCLPMKLARALGNIRYESLPQGLQ